MSFQGDITLIMDKIDEAKEREAYGDLSVIAYSLVTYLIKFHDQLCLTDRPIPKLINNQ